MTEQEVMSPFLLLRIFQLPFLQCFLLDKELFIFTAATIILCSISESCGGEVIVSKKDVCVRVCVCLHERNYEKTGCTV